MGGPDESRRRKVSRGNACKKEVKVLSLNEVPEEILVLILTFLPILDAIKTSEISRRWRNLWFSMSSLVFFRTPVMVQSYKLYRLVLPPDAIFINATLDRLRSQTQLLHSGLLKFHLEFSYLHHNFAPHVDSWIRYAVTHHAVNIHLNFFQGVNPYAPEISSKHTIYPFSFSALILDNNNNRCCVRYLDLSYCHLSVPPSNNNNVKFSSLRTLSLTHVTLTDETISDLMVACTNLETLKMMSFKGPNNIRISSPRLKELKLCFYKCLEGSVDIFAPSLQTLTFDCFVVGKYFLKGCSSLAIVDVYFTYHPSYFSFWSRAVRLICNCNVKRLVVQNWWCKLLATMDVFSRCFSLPTLKHLQLCTAYSTPQLLGIAALLERSPNLESMILTKNHNAVVETFDESKEFIAPTNFSIPSLKQVTMYFSGSKDEQHFLMLLLRSDIVLEKIVLIYVELGLKFKWPIVLTKQLGGFRVFPTPSLLQMLKHEITLMALLRSMSTTLPFGLGEVLNSSCE